MIVELSSSRKSVELQAILKLYSTVNRLVTVYCWYFSETSDKKKKERKKSFDLLNFDKKLRNWKLVLCLAIALEYFQ